MKDVLVVFSHGQESGPWGSKIQAVRLAAMRDLQRIRSAERNILITELQLRTVSEWVLAMTASQKPIHYFPFEFSRIAPDELSSLPPELVRRFAVKLARATKGPWQIFARELKLDVGMWRWFSVHPLFCLSILASTCLTTARLGGRDVHHTGLAFDLGIELLQRDGASASRPVRPGKRPERQHPGLDHWWALRLPDPMPGVAGSCENPSAAGRRPQRERASVLHSGPLSAACRQADPGGRNRRVRTSPGSRRHQNPS